MFNKKIFYIFIISLILFSFKCKSTTDNIDKNNTEIYSQNNWIIDDSLKEQPDIPARVKYSLMSNENIESFDEDFAQKLLNEDECYEFFSDSIITGPLLTDLMKDLEPDKLHDLIDVSVPLNIGGKDIVLKEFIVNKKRDHSGYDRIVKAIRSMILSDKPFKIRRPTYNELDWYWTIISYDI